MSGSSDTGSSRVNKGYYEQNVKFSDPQAKQLVSTLMGKLQSSLSGDNSNDALSETSAKTLADLMTGKYQVGTVNPYTQQLVDANAAKSANQFNTDFAKAYSNVQGLGQGASNQALGGVYQNYLLDKDAQTLNLLNQQYNTDIATALDAAKSGLGKSSLNQVGTLALGLGDLMKESYGYQPITTQESSRVAGGIKN